LVEDAHRSKAYILLLAKASHVLTKKGGYVGEYLRFLGMGMWVTDVMFKGNAFYD